MQPACDGLTELNQQMYDIKELSCWEISFQQANTKFGYLDWGHLWKCSWKPSEGSASLLSAGREGGGWYDVEGRVGWKRER